MESLDVKGAIITIDAMGCQKDIAAKIISKKADYVLALKRNQGSFYERVEQAFGHGFETDFKNKNYSYHQTADEGHGRIEERNCFRQVENNLHWMLNVQFRGDDGQKKAQNSATNFSLVL